MAAGLDVTRDDDSFVEKKIELLDVPEQDIQEGRAVQVVLQDHVSIYSQFQL